MNKDMKKSEDRYNGKLVPIPGTRLGSVQSRVIIGYTPDTKAVTIETVDKRS